MSTTTKVEISYSDRAKQYSHFTREWQTGMCGACCSDPLGCLGAIFCPQCCACHLRNQALNEDMTKYKCCQGQVCTSCCDRSCPCPCLCLFLEVSACLPCAVFSTRQYLKVERQLKDDGCDECLICCAGCVECANKCIKCLSCLTCGMCCCVMPCLDLANHILTSVVTCCMQAQVHHELRKFPTAQDYGDDDALLVVTVTKSVNTVQPGYTAQPQPGYAAQPQPGYAAQPQPGYAAQPQPGYAAQPQPGYAAQPNMMPVPAPTAPPPYAVPAVQSAPAAAPAAFCMKCGTKKTGAFCTQCGI